MGLRDYVEEHVGSLLDFGRVAASSVLSAASSVVLRIVGDEDPDGDEDIDECEVYGQAPLLYRPKAPDDSGAMEVLFARLGDERVVLATKDRRYQVEPAQGEVRIVALGKDGARQAQVRLKPDGVIVLEGVRIEIGAEGATETIALGTAIKGHFDALKSHIDSHTHPAGTLVDSTTGQVTGVTGPPSVSSPSVPDVESRHKVEN